MRFLRNILTLLVCLVAQFATAASNDSAAAHPQATCLFAVVPDSVLGDLGSGGGSITVKVKTSAGCAWNISADLDWVTISTTSGAGEATVTVKISPNLSTSERTGTITIAGYSFSFTQPAGTVCTFTVSGAAVEVSSAGTTATLQVSAPAGCQWSASASTDWITIRTQTSSSGSGTVTISISANLSTQARSGILNIAGQIFPIKQSGSSAECTYTYSGLELLTGAGQVSSLDIVAPSACSWVVSSKVPWIVITSGTSGTGNGKITFTVTPNGDNSTRTGTITIGGIDIPITQPGSQDGGCLLAFPGAEDLLASLLGSEAALRLLVNAPPRCTWAATSESGWITIPSGSAGTGSGAVELKVAPNTSGAPRTGTITIGGRTFQITQPAAACALGLSGTLAGGSGTISVQAGPDCNWQAAADVAWIRITAGAGTGNGTVAFELAANTGTAERAGTITIGGQTFRIVQPTGTVTACPYTYSGAALLASLLGNGGTVPVSISSLAPCSWTVVTDADWVKANGNTARNGSGTVEFVISPNTTGTPRTATVTIAGQTFTIHQSATVLGCTYTLDKPARVTVEHGGVEITIGVTAPPGCTWKAEWNAGWLQVKGDGTGSGSGTLKLVVAANPSEGPRQAQVTVGGTPITLMQAARAGDGAVVSAGGLVNAANPRSDLIARGSLFTVYGLNLGPLEPATPGVYPLQPSLGGLSVTVTQGTVSVQALPTYVSATQINAVMPSNAPLGDAQLTITRNGASVSAPVKIVATSLGLFASPDGRAVAQNHVSETEQPLNGPGSPARHGQIVILWGTGLGAVAGPDDGVPPVGNLPAAVEVTVGGKAAEMVYSGRSGCCAGADEIMFRVPDGAPSGCVVPVQIKAGGAFTNPVSIAVSGGGDPCKDDANPLADLSAEGKKAGVILLVRSEINTRFPPFFPTLTSTVDQAVAHFFETGPTVQPLLFPPIGACTTYRTDTAVGPMESLPGPWKELTGAAFGRELDAGAFLTLTAPDKSTYKLAGHSHDGLDTGPYWAILGMIASSGGTGSSRLVLNGGEFRISGAGGRQVGAFDITVNMPSPAIQWTNMDSIASVDRSKPLEVTWTGAGKDHLVLVGGSAADDSAIAGFVCSAAGESGRFSIPADILGRVPASSDSDLLSNLMVSAIASRNPVRFSAPGTDAGFVLPLTLAAKTVPYK